MRKLRLIVTLAVVYLLITGDASIMNGIVGLVLGVIITTVCRPGRNEDKEQLLLKRAVAVPLFAWGIAQELAK